MTEKQFAELTWFQRKHAGRIAARIAKACAHERRNLTKGELLSRIGLELEAAGYWSSESSSASLPLSDATKAGG